MDVDGVFRGLRVLDVTEGFAGAFCTMVLGDNGASVVRLVPLSDAERDPAAASAGARQWHRSKEIRRIDTGAGDDRQGAGALLEQADVVVMTDGGVMANALQLGDITELSADPPGLILCTIDGFGEHPSLRGLPPYEGVVTAAAGRMLDMGQSLGLGRPAFVAPPLAGFGAAHAAIQGICAALHVRERTGRGQHVRANMLRALTIYDFRGPEGMTLGTGLRPGRAPATPPAPAAAAPKAVAPAARPTPALFYIPARTRDGRWLQWANWSPHLFWQEAELLGLGHRKDEPGYRDLPSGAPPEINEAFWEEVLDATATRTADEWMAMLTERGTVGGDVYTRTRDGMDHPQARFNGDVITVDDPEVGPSEQLGMLVRMSATPGRVGVRQWTTDAPTASATTTATPATATAAAPIQGPQPRPPLDGVIVLEAATMVATPIGAVALADLGARVIRIEPLTGDPGRSLPFLKMVQDKESLAVDLRTPEGVAVVHRLVAKADMFVHNYRPGVPEKLGIDWPTLSRVNPRLVYLYAGAYGPAGPYARMPAYHPIAGAICGNAAEQAGDGAIDPAAELTAEERRARSLHLSRANEGHPDPVTGLVVASGLLLGLVARDRYGVGQDITATMLGANAGLMSDDWIRYQGAPARARVDGDILGTGPLNRLYRSSDGWVFLACPTEDDWNRLVQLLPNAGLGADARFSTSSDRHHNAGALAAALEEAFAPHRADDLERSATALGLGCARADRGTFLQFQQADCVTGSPLLSVATHTRGIGTHWRAKAIVDMDGIGDLGGAALAGEHTVPILDELGYDAEEIARLLDSGIVRSANVIADDGP